MRRISISARVFGLAAALGLAASARALPDVAGAFLLMCAIAALACVPQPNKTARQAVPIIEGGLIGLTLATGGFVGQSLGLYLIIPTLVAGLAGGTVIVASTLFAELAALAIVPLVRLTPALVWPSVVEALPWLLTAIGSGLLGAWIHRQVGYPIDDDHQRYVAAHRLLHELLVVSRRLSSGLDAVVLSNTLLSDCLTRVGAGLGAVLVRNEAGGLVFLTQHQGGFPSDALGDPVVLRCWETAEEQHADRPLPDAQDPSAGDEAPRRWALPVFVDARTVAVLVLDVDHHLDDDVVVDLRTLLDEAALPLDTALVFDEVRNVATAEERQRLAREIHDGVAQEIASLGYLVDDLAASAESARPAQIDRVRKELTRIVDDLRLSIFDLRSQVSRSRGLGIVLSEYLREVGLRSGPTVHLAIDETPDRLRLGVEQELLRIVQEAATNARKHSGAENLWVTCKVRPPAVELTVDDDGSGIHQQGKAVGFGLSIIRERAERIGATLSITNRAAGGTHIEVRVQAAEGSPRLLPHDVAMIWGNDPLKTKIPGSVVNV
jgi:signal transduction histidine kinase